MLRWLTAQPRLTLPDRLPSCGADLMPRDGVPVSCSKIVIRTARADPVLSLRALAGSRRFNMESRGRPPLATSCRSPSFLEAVTTLVVTASVIIALITGLSSIRAGRSRILTDQIDEASQGLVLGILVLLAICLGVEAWVGIGSAQDHLRYSAYVVLFCLAAVPERRKLT